MMIVRKAHALFPFALVLLMSCSGQTAKQNEIYNEDFKWSISIPADFENVSDTEGQRLKDKGVAAIEKTYGEPVENQAKPIFVFRSGQLNYFESNYQPFDEAVDGSYRESFRAVNQMIYETFKAQIPGVRIDSASATAMIDGLDFSTYNMKITYPNEMVMNFTMYSRLFDRKEFTVNIVYVDEAKGDQMKQAWLASKFKK